MKHEQGLVTLELALVMPLVAFLAWVALGVAGAMIDGLLLQEAARVGVRVAVTDADDAAVERAARAVIGDVGSDVRVDVVPTIRTPGSMVVVELSATRRHGPLPVELSARAAGVVEPLIGW